MNAPPVTTAFAVDSLARPTLAVAATGAGLVRLTDAAERTAETLD
ncbi:hypothetical protein ACWCOW_39030 [Streptomyces sp. NPDC001939]